MDENQYGTALIILKQLSKRTIAFNTIYSEITGSVTSGILLSQLIYWWNKMDGQVFYKTDKEIQEETTLGEYELMAAKNNLKKLEIVMVERKGVPAKSYYNINMEKLIDLVTSYGETTEPVMGKPRNWFRGNHGTIYTKDYIQKIKSKEFTSGEPRNDIKEESSEKSITEEVNNRKSIKEAYSDNEPERKVSIKKLTGEDNLKVLAVFKEYVYAPAKDTTLSVMDGIPRAISMFNEEFGGEGISNLIKVLKTLKITKKYAWMLQQGPMYVTPNVLLSKKFIENTLIPLSSNLSQHDGTILPTEMSDDELRQIEEDNERRYQQHITKHSKQSAS